MRSWPVGIFLEVAESLIGRALLFAMVVAAGTLTGLSIAAREFIVFEVGAGFIAAALIGVALDASYAILTLVLLLGAFVWLRFEIKPWFLAGVFVLAVVHGHRLFQLY
ncbi:MAG: hypothetical protein ABII82_15055 [Verrucomicrobiota bacterium]